VRLAEAGTGLFALQIGRFGSETGCFRQPSGVSVDRRGNILVSDSGNHRVQVRGGPNVKSKTDLGHSGREWPWRYLGCFLYKAFECLGCGVRRCYSNSLVARVSG
jgi:hypothetical protein